MCGAMRGSFSQICMPGARRLDRPIDAAKLRRRVGLHVERIEMARPAELMQEDDRLGASASAACVGGIDQRRELRAEHAGGADLQKFAASSGS